MSDKKKTTSEEKQQPVPQPLPPGFIPIDPAHFRAIPIIGIADCTK